MRSWDGTVDSTNESRFGRHRNFRSIGPRAIIYERIAENSSFGELGGTGTGGRAPGGSHESPAQPARPVVSDIAAIGRHRGVQYCMEQANFCTIGADRETVIVNRAALRDEVEKTARGTRSDSHPAQSHRISFVAAKTAPGTERLPSFLPSSAPSPVISAKQRERVALFVEQAC